jgi:prepilin-type processing-associated H-X9-DG protein
MSRLTERDKRITAWCVFMALSIVLAFVADRAQTKQFMLDRLETEVPSNYHTITSMSYLGSLLACCAAWGMAAPSKSRILTGLVAAIPWFVIVFVATVHAWSWDQSRYDICIRQMRQMSISFSLYASDNNDHLPTEHWMDGVAEYQRDGREIRCPAVKAPGYGIALSKSIVGDWGTKDPKTQVLAYDSLQLQRNAVGDIKRDFATRHRGKGSVLFADSHARHMPAAAFSQ